MNLFNYLLLSTTSRFSFYSTQTESLYLYFDLNTGTNSAELNFFLNFKALIYFCSIKISRYL